MFSTVLMIGIAVISVTAVAYPFLENLYYKYKPSQYSMSFINNKIKEIEEEIDKKDLENDYYELKYQLDLLDWWNYQKSILEFQQKHNIV